MGQLIHKTGDLFSAAEIPGAVLVHAVSTQGVWGAGIAVEFKRRWPDAFQFYAWRCNEFGVGLLGTSYVWLAQGRLVDRLAPHGPRRRTTKSKVGDA